MSSDKWKPSLLSVERSRFIVSVCRILFYVVICTTAAVVAYSWNLFSIIGVYSNMASWWILFVTIFLAPPTISLNPITLDDRVPRPAGQAVASIWLVGRITCCHGGNDLSFHHYDTAAFAASDLALSPPPSPAVFAGGLFFVCLNWGASRVVPKCLSDSVWLVSLVPKQCPEENCIESLCQLQRWIVGMIDSYHVFEVLCCQFANKAVSCKFWGSHRGGTEDLCLHLQGFLDYPEVGDTEISRNVGNYLPCTHRPVP